MKLLELQTRVEELQKQMQDPAVVSDRKKMQAVAREYSEKKEILDYWLEVEKLQETLKQNQNDLEQETDPEMIKLINEEVAKLEEKLAGQKKQLDSLLNPNDPNDKKNIIMEIRAGTGGDESALFAASLFRMYSRFAERQNWKTSFMSANRTSLGGYKEVIFEISGQNVYKFLKYESGVHRVQRVPETEKSGRVHTSAATVAVLPEAEEIDIDIKPEDLRIDTFMAGGHGGQSVNTTYSAIRVTHLPTNTVVICQDEKSQQQNRLKALTVLRSRLLAAEEERARTERSEARNSQIGSGDRSEKIRTYNFPQNRVTDHRIKYSSHNLAGLMDGDLLELITALQKADVADQNN